MSGYGVLVVGGGTDALVAAAQAQGCGKVAI